MQVAPQLPVELIGQIVIHIQDRRDLCRLATVSRTVQLQAEPEIYRRVDLHTSDRIFFACRTLTSTPRIAPYVRYLSVKPDDRCSGQDLQDAWDGVGEALKMLTKLKVLKLYYGGRDGELGWDLASIFTDCTFRLNALHSNFILSEGLAQFLRSQTELEVLDLLGKRMEQDSDIVSIFSPLTFQPGSSTNTLRRLRVLRTHHSTLALILAPQRPITHLWVPGRGMASNAAEMFDPQLYFNLIDKYALTSAESGVVSFRMDMGYSKSTVVPVLSRISERMPNLRSLGFIPLFTERDTDIIEGLSRFPHLHSIAITSPLPISTLPALSQACPTLRLVACLHYSYSHEYLHLPVNQTGERPRAVHDPDNRLWLEA